MFAILRRMESAGDITTEAGRAARRNRRAAMTSAAGIGARLISAAVSIVTVPILVSYFGVERYGIWLTVLAGATWLALVQLGLSPSLLNRLSRLRPGDIAERPLVSTAWWIAGGLGLLAVAPLVLVWAFAPWEAVFNVDSPELAMDARAVTAAVWIGVAASLPLAIPSTILRARQEGYLANALDVLGALGRLAIVFWLPLLRADMTAFGIAFAGWSVVLGVLGAGAVFGARWPSLRPSPGLFDRAICRQLLREGLAFTGLGLASLVIMFADALVITQVLGPASVPPYAVPFSLLTLFLGLQLVILDAVWPAYSESGAQGDSRWLLATHARLTKVLTAASAAFGIVLVTAGPWALEVWAGAAVVPPVAVLVAFALIAVIQGYEVPQGRVLLALGHVRAYTALGLLNAAINLPVSIALAGPLGITGVAIGTVLGYAVTLPVITVSARRTLRELSNVGRA